MKIRMKSDGKGEKMRGFKKGKTGARQLVLTLTLLALCSVGCGKQNIETRSDNITEITAAQTTEDTSLNTIEQDTDTFADNITENTAELTTEKISETNDFVKKEIKLDLYKIPEIYSSILTDEEIDFYNKFVTAWINYEPVVEFEDDRVLEKVWGMVQECFFLAYGDLDMSTGYDVVDHQVNLHYLSYSKEEHDEIIRQFEERVQYFFEDIDEKEEGIELALHLYTNYNRTLEYSYYVVDSDNFTFENSSGYAAMMHGSGVCMSFAKAYSYLLRQAGFEAFDVSNIDHEWTVIRIDGKYYFADPTWDYVNEPEDYIYFCFGLDQREEDGYPKEGMCLCCNGDIKMLDYVDIERNSLKR